MLDKNSISWELRFQGAEAKIWSGHADGKPVIRKERFAKTYRHATLDARLTKERIRAESRSISRLKKNCPDLRQLLPDVLAVDESDIIMTEIVDAQTLAEYIRGLAKPEIDASLLEKIGATIAKIHSSGIVHGDITTSNLLVDKDQSVIPIDFGLSTNSNKTEDRAVDLYVLERSFLTGSALSPVTFETILSSYCDGMKEKGNEIKRKLDEVRMRGRKRSMVG